MKTLLKKLSVITLAVLPLLSLQAQAAESSDSSSSTSDHSGDGGKGCHGGSCGKTIDGSFDKEQTRIEKQTDRTVVDKVHHTSGTASG